MSASVRLVNMLPVPSPPRTAVPQPAPASISRVHSAVYGKPVGVEVGSTYTRQAEWHTHVRARTSAMQHEQELQQAAACTFRPNTSKIDVAKGVSSSRPRCNTALPFRESTPLATLPTAGYNHLPDDVAAAKAAVDAAFSLALPFIHALKLAGPTPRPPRQEAQTVAPRLPLTRDSIRTQTPREPAPPRCAAPGTPTRSASAPLTRLTLVSATPKATADGPVVPPMDQWYRRWPCGTKTKPGPRNGPSGLSRRERNVMLR
jgi:hypothetical protein